MTTQASLQISANTARQACATALRLHSSSAGMSHAECLLMSAVTVAVDYRCRPALACASSFPSTCSYVYFIVSLQLAVQLQC